jgi:hypothetical protein
MRGERLGGRAWRDERRVSHLCLSACQYERRGTAKSGSAHHSYSSGGRRSPRTREVCAPSLAEVETSDAPWICDSEADLKRRVDRGSRTLLCGRRLSTANCTPEMPHPGRQKGPESKSRPLYARRRQIGHSSASQTLKSTSGLV